MSAEPIGRYDSRLLRESERTRLTPPCAARCQRIPECRRTAEPPLYVSVLQWRTLIIARASVSFAS